MKNPIKAGQEFPVIILLKNTYQNTAVTNVKLQLELPQGLSMNAEQITDTLDVKDIQPGQERKVKVKLIAGKLDGDIPTLIIKAKVSYDFTAGDQVKLGGSEKNILLPVSGDQGQQPQENPGEGEGPAYGGGGDYGGSGSGGSEKKHIDPMTPNIIISSYEYDKDLKAGQAFILKLVLLNTSRQNTIENLVMSVEAGEALSIEDSSNTTYIERLKPHETYTKEMRLKVLPQGVLENAKLDISFKYEYLKKEERAQVTSAEKFAIRFSQPDRFSVGDIQKEKEIYANEEATVSIPYVNKGKTAVYNMEARMETGMTSEETYKFLGNVEPGTSGTIDFFVTALEPGKQKVKITLTYEDASGNEKTVEKEAELTVQEQNLDEMSGYGFVDEAMATDGDVNKAGVFSIDMLTNKAVMIPAVVVVLAFVVFMVRRKKKKRLQQEEEENF